MKVRELIEVLGRFDPELEVGYPISDGFYDTPIVHAHYDDNIEPEMVKLCADQWCGQASIAGVRTEYAPRPVEEAETP